MLDTKPYEPRDLSAKVQAVNERPLGIRSIMGGDGIEIRHHTGGTNSISTLLGPGVSCHLLHRKNETIRIAPDRLRAWHAGYSRYQGRNDCNNFSLGDEIENLGDGRDPYTDFQYNSVAYHSALREFNYGIVKRTTHKAVRDEFMAKYPGFRYPDGRLLERKTDPVGWDMEKESRLRAVYLEQLRGTPPPHPVILPPPTDLPIWFPETEHSIGGGIGRYFLDGGGVTEFGFPVSDEMAETIEGQVYTVQYFQRARLEYNPRTGAITEGLVGYEVFLLKYA
jgi:hypothetical protein